MSSSTEITPAIRERLVEAAEKVAAKEGPGLSPDRVALLVGVEFAAPLSWVPQLPIPHANLAWQTYSRKVIR